MADDPLITEINRKLDRHIEESRSNNKSQNDILQALLIQSTESKSSIININDKIAEQKISIIEIQKDTESLKGSRTYMAGALWAIGGFLGFFISVSPFILPLLIEQSVREALAQFDIIIK